MIKVNSPKVQVSGTAVIKDKHGNIKGEFEFQGESVDGSNVRNSAEKRLGGS